MMAQNLRAKLRTVDTVLLWFSCGVRLLFWPGGFIPCLLFWIPIIAAGFIRIIGEPKSIIWVPIVQIGAGMNAAIMLMNGGFMPVLRDTCPANGVWRVARASDRLLIFADRGEWLGFSLGDMFLIVGLSIHISQWFY